MHISILAGEEYVDNWAKIPDEAVMGESDMTCNPKEDACS